ncbi:BQ5605_C003g01864 [Microbotryum silenes-dioicae]|uniref:BQ5605_C003g01864 protein n=1 Tax=Microbotryum silenes-dioicae TaxID=796604 RepID=A0A2X0M3K7_9BASI|nr:BQ5605_C003g01864 [Microbotryum silenes-dioicae]
MSTPPRRTRPRVEILELAESPKSSSGSSHLANSAAIVAFGTSSLSSPSSSSSERDRASSSGDAHTTKTTTTTTTSSKTQVTHPDRVLPFVLTNNSSGISSDSPTTASPSPMDYYTRRGLNGGTGHRSSPSASPLLPSRSSPGRRAAGSHLNHDDGLDEIDRDAPRRWARFKKDYQDDRPGMLGAIDRTKDFVKRNEGFLLIGAAQAFFATISACVKVRQRFHSRCSDRDSPSETDEGFIPQALQEQMNMPVWELILIRMSLTWIGCYTWMRCNNVEHPFLGPPGVRFLLAARGFVGFWGIAPLYYSLRYIPLSDATVLGFLAPFIIGVLGSVFLGEAYSLTEGLVALVSLCGVVLIAKPSFLFPGHLSQSPEGVTPEQRTFAVFVCLGSSFGSAAAYLLIRKIGKRASATHSIAYFSIYCCLVSSLYPIFFDSPPVFYFNDPTFWLLITPIGIFGFVAQALLTLGLQREAAGRGSLAVFSNLLFAMLIEKIVFGKWPDFLSLCGAMIIVAGGFKIALMKVSQANQAVVQGTDRGRGEQGEEERDLEGGGGALQIRGDDPSEEEECSIRGEEIKGNGKDQTGSKHLQVKKTTKPRSNSFGSGLAEALLEESEADRRSEVAATALNR